jgi:hypothetical protein
MSLWLWNCEVGRLLEESIIATMAPWVGSLDSPLRVSLTLWGWFVLQCRFVAMKKYLEDRFYVLEHGKQGPLWLIAFLPCCMLPTSHDDVLLYSNIEPILKFNHHWWLFIFFNKVWSVWWYHDAGVRVPNDIKWWSAWHFIACCIRWELAMPFIEWLD